MLPDTPIGATRPLLTTLVMVESGLFLLGFRTGVDADTSGWAGFVVADSLDWSRASCSIRHSLRAQGSPRSLRLPLMFLDFGQILKAQSFKFFSVANFSRVHTNLGMKIIFVPELTDNSIFLPNCTFILRCISLIFDRLGALKVYCSILRISTN